jgi:hypothetical protein
MRIFRFDKGEALSMPYVSYINPDQVVSVDERRGPSDGGIVVLANGHTLDVTKPAFDRLKAALNL